jgi:hypothetical protein
MSTTCQPTLPGQDLPRPLSPNRPQHVQTEIDYPPEATLPIPEGERWRMMLDALRQHGPLPSSKIGAKAGLSPCYVARDLRQLALQGKVRQLTDGRWELVQGSGEKVQGQP